MKEIIRSGMISGKRLFRIRNQSSLGLSCEHDGAAHAYNTFIAGVEAAPDAEPGMGEPF